MSTAFAEIVASFASSVLEFVLAFFFAFPSFFLQTTTTKITNNGA